MTAQTRPAPSIAAARELWRELVDLAYADRQFASYVLMRRAVEPTLGLVEHDGEGCCGPEALEDQAAVVETFTSAHLIVSRHPGGGEPLVTTLLARTDLEEPVRAMLRSWTEWALFGYFEVLHGPISGEDDDDGAVVQVRHLLSDRTCAVVLPPGSEVPVRGEFLHGCLVPVGERWMTGGGAFLRDRDADTVLAVTVQTLVASTASPEQSLRNPAVRTLVEEAVRERAERFRSVAGSDVVSGTGSEMAEVMARYRGLAPRKAACQEASTTALSPDEEACEDIGLVLDEHAGVCVVTGFGRLDRAFAFPPSDPHEPEACLIRDFLRHPVTFEAAIAAFRARHPETFDDAVRIALDRPGSTWVRDGERLYAELHPMVNRAGLPLVRFRPQIVRQFEDQQREQERRTKERARGRRVAAKRRRRK